MNYKEEVKKARTDASINYYWAEQYSVGSIKYYYIYSDSQSLSNDEDGDFESEDLAWESSYNELKTKGEIK